MLIVLIVIGALAGLLLPALSTSKVKSQGIMCLNNNRQLCLAWHMYVDDNNDRFPDAFQWVPGKLDFDPQNPANTDPGVLQKGLFNPYLARSTLVYRCPADESKVTGTQGKIPRIRSVSMNDAFSQTGPSLPASAGWKTYQRRTDLVAPSPGMHWLLIDEHPDSIGDGAFGVNCQNQGAGARFVDFPAAFHSRAASLG
ncbi:MAG: hypothetical protein HYZ36_05005, partial [Pedosphaera parvula]|nr:hypothetical protein [Pedosphaera parvula]